MKILKRTIGVVLMYALIFGLSYIKPDNESLLFHLAFPFFMALFIALAFGFAMFIKYLFD